MFENEKLKLVKYIFNINKYSLYMKILVFMFVPELGQNHLK